MSEQEDRGRSEAATSGSAQKNQNEVNFYQKQHFLDIPCEGAFSQKKRLILYIHLLTLLLIDSRERARV